LINIEHVQDDPPEIFRLQQTLRYIRVINVARLERWKMPSGLLRICHAASCAR